MSISVLSQHSVDRLRVLVKSGEQILSRSFDEIIEAYSLQTVDLDIEFDSSVELLLPTGIKQAENNDDSNCLKIAAALPDLSEIVATDERLWTTLALRDYKTYSTARWSKWQDEGVEIPSYVRDHWFASNSRGLMRDQSISRLWWCHQLCSRISSDQVGETLKALLFNSDYRSSMLERNGTSAISMVVEVILEVTAENARIGLIYNRPTFRRFMKSLDLLAGRSRLSVLEKDQLKTLLNDLYVKAYESE